MSHRVWGGRGRGGGDGGADGCGRGGGEGTSMTLQPQHRPHAPPPAGPEPLLEPLPQAPTPQRHPRTDAAHQPTCRTVAGLGAASSLHGVAMAGTEVMPRRMARGTEPRGGLAPANAACVAAGRACMCVSCRAATAADVHATIMPGPANHARPIGPTPHHTYRPRSLNCQLPANEPPHPPPTNLQAATPATCSNHPPASQPAGRLKYRKHACGMGA